MTLYQADARQIPLPDQSVHCVVTSPPYYGLRVYEGVQDAGIGLEASISDYVTSLVGVFGEVQRVLREDGVCWVNLGDTRSRDPAKGRHEVGDSGKEAYLFDIGAGRASECDELPEGNRLGIPERVVMALQAAGWIWRDTVIWAKPSVMPESVNGWRWEQCRVKVGSVPADWCERPKAWQADDQSHDVIPKGNYRIRDGVGPHPSGDIAEANVAEWADCPGCPKCGPNDGLVLRKGSWRCTSSFEYIYMLVKGMGYYADGEAVKTVASSWNGGGYRNGSNHMYATGGRPGKADSQSTANRRSVWSDISPEPYRKPKGSKGHYATFASDLPRICIQASTSEKGCCPRCGSQWARVVDHKNMQVAKSGTTNGMRTGLFGTQIEPAESMTTGWRHTCGCVKYGLPLVPAPTMVLDPFAGTATTCMAAQRLGRRSVGIELSEDYLKQAVKRLEGVPLPLR